MPSVKTIVLTVFLPLIVLAGPLKAQDVLQRGMKAYKVGAYGTALKLLRPLARQQNSAAERQLSVMYFLGHGVRVDTKQALNWQKRAALHGNIDAQVSMGKMHQNGLYLSQSFPKAAKWFRLASEPGELEAQVYLGNLYERGLGVQKNHLNALRWYKAAAEQGHSGGQMNLGIAYSEGVIISKDNVLAYMWLEVADRSDKQRPAWLVKKALRTLLSQIDIAKATRLADECIDKNFKNCGL